MHRFKYGKQWTRRLHPVRMFTFSFVGQIGKRRHTTLVTVADTIGEDVYSCPMASTRRPDNDNWSVASCVFCGVHDVSRGCRCFCFLQPGIRQLPALSVPRTAGGAARGEGRTAHGDREAVLPQVSGHIRAPFARSAA